MIGKGARVFFRNMGAAGTTVGRRPAMKIGTRQVQASVGGTAQKRIGLASLTGVIGCQ